MRRFQVDPEVFMRKRHISSIAGAMVSSKKTEAEKLLDEKKKAREEFEKLFSGRTAR